MMLSLGFCADVYISTIGSRSSCASDHEDQDGSAQLKEDTRVKSKEPHCSAGLSMTHNYVMIWQESRVEPWCEMSLKIVIPTSAQTPTATTEHEVQRSLTSTDRTTKFDAGERFRV